MAISIDTLRSLDANARFETLDGTSKKKAAIVIGVLGQESEKAVINGCGYALDPRGLRPRQMRAMPARWRPRA